MKWLCQLGGFRKSSELPPTPSTPSPDIRTVAINLFSLRKLYGELKYNETFQILIFNEIVLINQDGKSLHQATPVNDLSCQCSLTTFQIALFYSNKQQNSGCIAPSTKLSAYVSKINLVYSSTYVVLSGVVNAEDSESRLNCPPSTSRYPDGLFSPKSCSDEIEKII
ncbi:hypothetical protein CDAR_22821 [Caerostris darwini]|uniref:Uncharacterized protein n=1 Tax=Caerostris darwini TaxID=1538125 RepID=A0AAV4M520_9ARAC|nr:hypothetical protein CDAR_22821 [Caerostris darwini]